MINAPFDYRLISFYCSQIRRIPEKLGFENDAPTAFRDSILVKFGFRLASEGDGACKKGTKHAFLAPCCPTTYIPVGYEPLIDQIAADLRVLTRSFLVSRHSLFRY